MPKAFLKFASYMQVVAIIFVVLSHSLHQYPDGNLGRTTYAYLISAALGVALFMFVSGMLLAYASTPDQGSYTRFRSFTFAKCRRLLVPFVVLTLVTFVPRSLMSGYADDAITLSLGSLIGAFFDSQTLVIPYLWFLQSCFTLLVLCYAFLLLCAKLSVKTFFADTVLLTIAVLLLRRGPGIAFFSLGETMRFAIYFVCGIVYGQFMDRIDRIVPWTSCWFLILSTAIFVALFMFAENPFAQTVSTLVAVVATISLTKILVRHNVRIFNHLVGANYMIFLLSWYFNVFAQQILSHYISLPWYIHTAMSLLMGIYLPWLAYRLMLRHRHTAAARHAATLLGQKL